MFILEIIIPILFMNFAESITIKNFHFVYSGYSKLGLVNEKFVIECPMKAQFYLWKVYQYQSDPRVLLEQEGRNVTIDSVTTDKTGIYECKGTTGFTNTDANITVKIIDPNSDSIKDFCSLAKPPKNRDLTKGICFYNEKSNNVAPYKTGDNVELDCTAVGNDLKYFWKFNNENRVKTQIQIGVNISKIIIKSVTPENEGFYKCEVTNDYGQKVTKSFKVVLSDFLPDRDIDIVGEKQEEIKEMAGQNIQMKCEVKNNYNRIYSIKWGKRIKSTDSDLSSKSNVVSWDQFTYKLLPENDIKETNINSNHVVSILTLNYIDSDHSGVYTCLAMDARGRTVHKTFNLTVSSGNTTSEPTSKSYFFLLYILLPAILIFAFICATIYCCVKSSSKKSQNSLPLKKYSSPKQTNPTKEPVTNYYYQGNNNRPPLPPPNESQASLVSPNTLTTYSSYGNYHVPSKSHPSCCSSNDV